VKKLFALLAIAFLIGAPTLFAKSKSYSGTVTMLHEDGGFMMETKDGTVVTVQTSSKTKFTHANNKAGKHKDLAEGMHVDVKMMSNGKTAESIKMTPEKK
jgi:uncharacterized protein YxeA